MKKSLHSVFAWLQARRLLAALLAVAILLGSLATGISLYMKDAHAATVPGNVITNYPFDPGEPGGPPPNTSIEAIVSGRSIIDHPGYDRAYTEAISAQHNGTATDRHVVIKDGKVTFFGYDMEPYTDSVTYSNISSASGISFSIRPVNMNYHTFKESGVTFGDYKLALVADKWEGTTASLKLMDSSGNVVGTYITGIQNLSTTPIKIELQTSGSNVNVYVNGNQVASVPANLASNFGFYTEYFYHDCPILTIMQFDDVVVKDMVEKDAQSSAVSSIVYFKDVYTGETVATPHTRSGHVGQKYKIDIPSSIESWVYVSNSRNNSTTLIDNLVYQSGTNATTLYYARPYVRVDYYVNGTKVSSTVVDRSTLAFNSAYKHTAPATYTHNGETARLVTSPNNKSFTPTVSNPGTVMRFDYSIPSLTIKYMSGGTTLYTENVPITSLTFGTAYSHTAPVSYTYNKIGYMLNDNGTKMFTPTLDNPSGTLVFQYKKPPNIIKSARVYHTKTGKWEDFHTGSESVPVQVEVGDYIGYYIDAKAPTGLTNETVYTGTTVETRTGYVDTLNSRYNNVERQFVEGALFTATKESLESSYWDPQEWLMVATGVDGWKVRSTATMKLPDFSKISGFKRITGMTASFTFEPSGENKSIWQYVQTADMLYYGDSLVIARYCPPWSYTSQYDGTFSYEGDPLPVVASIPSTYWKSNEVIPFSFGYDSSNKNLGVPYNQTGWLSSKTVWGDANASLGAKAIRIDYTYEIDAPVYEQVGPSITISDNVPNGTVQKTWTQLQSANSTAYSRLNASAYTRMNESSVSRWGSFSSGTAFKYQLVAEVTSPSTINSNDLFVNQARMDYNYLYTLAPATSKRTELSNFTYHTTREMDPPVEPTIYNVVENYVELNNTSNVLKPQYLEYVSEGGTYRPTADATDTITKMATDYKYYGYQLNGTGAIIRSDPPNPMFTDIQSNKTVTYFYVKDPAVKVQFFEYTTGTTTNVLKDEYSTTVDYGGSFSANLSDYSNITRDGYVYRFVGNDPGTGGYRAGQASTPVYTNITSDKTLKLYFRRDPVVTVDFKKLDDPTGDSIKTPRSDNTVRGDDYILSVGDLNSIDISSDTYNYYGYTIGDDTTIIPGQPPIPVFSDVQDDQKITLYFADDPVVIVHFVEYLNDGRILKNDVRVPVSRGNDYTPTTELLESILSSDGKTYDYKAYKWDTDADLTLEDTPPQITNVTSNRELTLYFATKYKIIEKFHVNQKPTETVPYIELAPDITTTLEGGSDFDGDPPAVIEDGTTKWIYVGYKNDYDSNDVIDGVPSIDDVRSDYTIIYVYEADGASTSVTVTERFREKDNTSHIFDPDNLVSVDVGDAYNPAPGTPKNSYTEDGTTYTYWGYQLDNETPVEGAPPADLFDPISGPHTITYLYEPSTNPRVTERWRELGNLTNELKSDESHPVDIGDDFNRGSEPETPLTKGTKTYEYYGYQIDDGAVITTPLADIPATLLSDIQEGHTITYLYRTTYTITEKYYDDSTPGVNIKTPDKTTTVYSGGGFVGDPDDSILYNGFNYDYKDEYTLDGTPGTGTPTFSNITDDHTIVYIYEKGATYTVTEKYQEYGNPTNVLKTDVVTGDKQIGNTFTPSANVPSIDKSTKTYEYYGYSVDGGTINVSATNPPEPSEFEVSGNHEIIYYYRTTYTITEQFVDDGTPATKIKTPDNQITVYSGDNYTGNPPSSIGYDGFNYNYTDEHTLDGTPGTGKPTLTNITDDHTAVFIYEKGESINKILHIRQVVVDYGSSKITLPTLGFYELGNAGTKYNATSASGLDGNSVKYTDYSLIVDSTNKNYSVDTVIPQYYEYVGHHATTDNGNHDSSTRESGAISLDYTTAHEYWVTVYITPQGTPENFAWDFVTNEFGTIFKK